MKHRIPRIARGQPFDIAARFSFQYRAAGGIARGFTHQRCRQHPRALHAREIAVMCRPAQVPDPPLRVAAPQADDAREKPRQRARAREAVVVYPEPEIAIRAG
ncbi:MAG: hypothetical protein ACREMI_04490 [Gemmatimonadales bacterium]